MSSCKLHAQLLESHRMLPCKRCHWTYKACGTRIVKASMLQCLRPSRADSRRTQYGKACRSRLALAAIAGAEDAALLEEVLETIKSSPNGDAAGLSPEAKAAVDSKLARLEELGQQQQPRPLEDPDIWGNWNVAYTSSGSRQTGQPAGGRFRSRLGRLIFRTTAICQSILQPDIVTNKVEFRLLGLVRGSVGLRGRLQPVGDDKATVRVDFEPPRMCFAGGIDLPIGPTSDVVLTTTHVTPAVRLGRGSRGSLFVFTKGGAADQQGMEAVGTGRSTAGGWLLIAALLAGLLAAAAGLWRQGTAGRVAAVFPAALAALLARAAVGGALERPPA